MEEKSIETVPPLKGGKFAINKNLVMLKITLFFLYGANSSLLPYLTVHMQSIGLTVRQTSIIYLTLPLTTFLTPPLTGFLVDRFGQYKPVVIVSFLLTAIIHHSLFIIPHQELPGVVPDGYVMRHPKGDVEVWWSPCPSRECPVNEELDLVLDACVDHCLLKQLNNTSETSVNKNSILDLGEEDDLVFRLGSKDGVGKPSAVLFVLDMHPDLGDPVEALGMEMESNTATNFKTRFNKKLLLKAGVNFTDLDESDLRCGGIVLRANYTSKQRLEDWTGDCIVQKCRFREGGPEVCPPDYKESGSKTYWIYFVLRFIGSIVMTVGITIIDPIALAMIEKYGGDFGKEKLFSSLGMALFSPITGALIDYSSKRLGYTDYSPAFFTYDILLVISAISVYLMPLGSQLPADNLFKDLVGIFKMPHIIVFIIFMFLLGNPWGFIENYLFLYLKDLGARNALLGITVTVGTISSLPFLYGAENITKKIGHINVIIIAFFAQATRLVGYSFIESAWWCFPFEALESLSVHLMWVAAATYCSIIAPKGLLATLIGVIAMAHFSIGRGFGSFLGGLLIGEFGIREAFRLMGLTTVICGLFYGLLHYFWLRKIMLQSDDNENDKCNKVELLGKPRMVDQSTMVSFERLSLVVEYNQVGSISSLGRANFRRGSDCYGMYKRSRGSASKVEFLKSSTEVNNSRNSIKYSGHLSRLTKSTSFKITDNKTSSVSKLPTPSLSLSPILQEKEIKHLIPDEEEEIIYNTTKKITGTKVTEKSLV